MMTSFCVEEVMNQNDQVQSCDRHDSCLKVGHRDAVLSRKKNVTESRKTIG